MQCLGVGQWAGVVGEKREDWDRLGTRSCSENESADWTWNMSESFTQTVDHLT